VKVALFYEIPVARPWDERSEYRAYQEVLEQVQLGDKLGFHSFWTVEHHFLEEFSHCSNPEVLYGAVASTTKNIRIGYGVRLVPKPYNHPTRTAESVAVLDLISGGRVEFGTGRSATRAELEGFGIHPDDTREMWEEGLRHIVTCWTNETAEYHGKHWDMPPRMVLPKPLQKPHPPLWAATTSPEGHEVMGRHGLGVCSFTVGLPPEDLEGRIDLYRKGLEQCTDPIGAYVNNQVATFTMVHCDTDRKQALATAKDSFEWYVAESSRRIGTVFQWMQEMKQQDAGTYAYTANLLEADKAGKLEKSIDYLYDVSAGVVGDPDDCIRHAKKYEAAGCDLLLCLLNPYKMPHDAVMRSIELMGKHVLPEFERA
jgi:alkanesulfonate monooxygenase SsuD/methylene tetrahydromethanopterin reductase-like flavin-dependent oxidoreductase (luciferase family)